MEKSGRVALARGMHVVDVRGYPVGSVEAVTGDRFAVLASDGESSWLWTDAIFTIDETGTVSLVCNRASLARYNVANGRATG